MEGRILSRDKKFLEAVRVGLEQSVGVLEELARDGTEGVATKAEVREMQMENRALMSTMARGEWKKQHDNEALQKAEEEVSSLKEALSRSQAEMGRLNSRSRYLADQNASMASDGLQAALPRREGSSESALAQLYRHTAEP